ncbi:MAG: c-type cytochrome [Caulobacteraceae bacterium]
MSDLGFNKVAGAVLATGLAIFGLRELSSMIYEKEPVTKPGYAIAVQEEAEGGAAAAEVAPDWGTVLPVADVKAGEGVHQKCLSCHTFDPGGANGTGPGLYGVVMRKPGSHPGYSYSAAMTEFGGKNPAWTYDQLDQFLKAPTTHVPGTKMTFVGLKKQEDRINIIAFLRTLAASPAAIPAPNPAAAAAPAGSEAAPAASGAASVVASGGTASNAGAQQAAPSSGPAAAPTQVTKPTRAEG